MQIVYFKCAHTQHAHTQTPIPMEVKEIKNFQKKKKSYQENLFSMLLLDTRKVKTFRKHFNVKQGPICCRAGN